MEPVRPVPPAPVVAFAGSDSGICAGGSIAIGGPASGGVAPYNYSWTSDGCAEAGCAGAGESITVSPTATTVYTQHAFDASGKDASASITVAVSPDPGSAGTDRWIDPWEATTIGPDAIANASYAWSCNRADCAISDPAASRTTVSPLLSTQYTLGASSGPGCAPTSAMTVWVKLQSNSVPDTGATAFPVSSALEVLFDRPIAAASLSATSVYLEDAVSGARIPVSTSLDASGKLLTITPPASGTGGYQAGNDYTLYLLSGASGVVSDDAVLPNVLGSDLMIDFTTGGIDISAPGLSFRSPSSGESGVPINTRVVGLFDEPVDPTTVSDANIALVCGGIPVSTHLGYDFVGRTFQLVPNGALPASTGCTVTLVSVRDLSGNAATISWSFTTGTAPDLTPPSVVGFNPADGATGVDATSSVSVIFNESIDSTTLPGALSLVRDSDGAAVAGTVTYNPNTLTASFTPRAMLDGTTTYRFSVSGAKDLAGNATIADASARFVTMRRLFFDDFEHGTDLWSLPAATSGVSWGLSTRTFRSATHSLTDSPSGKYASNVVSTAELGAPLEVAGASEIYLQFSGRVRTERNADYFFVDYSYDGLTWNELGKSGAAIGWNGNSGWARNPLAIPTTGADLVYLRFRLTSSSKKNFDGVYLDDVLLQAP